VPLRDEFQLLDEKCTKLRQGKELDQDFLKEVRTHIELCEHIAKTDEERSVIGRTTYWWRKRANLFGLGMKAKEPPKLLPAGTGVAVLTFNDKRFLRSLRIKVDENEDDGAGNR